MATVEFPFGAVNGDVLPELKSERFERPLRKDFNRVSLGEILSALGKTGETLTFDDSFWPSFTLFSTSTLQSSANKFQRYLSYQNSYNLDQCICS